MPLCAPMLKEMIKCPYEWCYAFQGIIKWKLWSKSERMPLDVVRIVIKSNADLTSSSFPQETLYAVGHPQLSQLVFMCNSILIPRLSSKSWFTVQIYQPAHANTGRHSNNRGELIKSSIFYSDYRFNWVFTKFYNSQEYKSFKVEWIIALEIVAKSNIFYWYYYARRPIVGCKNAYANREFWLIWNSMRTEIVKPKWY